MPIFKAVLRRLRDLLGKSSAENEMAEELRTHMDELIASNIRAGMKPEVARDQALCRFGGIERIKDQCRDETSWIWFEQFVQDVRHATRSAARHPGFACVTIATLALGFGASIGAFSLVNALFLRKLAAQEPTQLAIVSRSSPLQDDTWSQEAFPFPLYQHFRDQSQSFTDLTAFLGNASINPSTLVATGFGSNVTEPVRASPVAGNYFSVLGVPAILGNTLGTQDASYSAVLSHAYWQRRFGSDPAIIGRSISVNNVSYTIVGVALPGFVGVETGISNDVWLSLNTTDAAARNETIARVKIIGRLRPGVSHQQAQSELEVLFKGRFAEIAAANRERTRWLAGKIEVRSGAVGYDRPFVQHKPLLPILAAVVGLVLLVACANVAGLFLARWFGQQREFAVRAALGAGRGRLVRSLLVQSLLFALAGGLIGLMIAAVGMPLLAAELLRGVTADFSPDLRVFGFALLFSVVFGVLVGLVPAIHCSREGLSPALKQGTASSGSRPRLNRTLVVAQIALSMCLVTGAGLFIRTLHNLKNIDLGFDQDNVLTFRLLSTPSSPLEITQALERIPGVQSVTSSFPGPLVGGSASPFVAEGYEAAPEESMVLSSSHVGPRFFETLGIPLVRGRDFEEREAVPPNVQSARPVAVISQSLADKYFKQRDPIGRHIELRFSGADLPPFEIIGVARDTHYQTLRESAFKFYSPHPGIRVPRTTFQVRTSIPAATIGPAIRSAVQEINPRVLVADIRTLREVAETHFAHERSIARVAGVFSALALVLASIGLYGLLAYGVERRTREIGLRIALGACRRDILSLIVREGVVLAAWGCALGLASAVALARIVEARLFGVTSTDPVNIVTTVGILFAVVVLASWLPARRAAGTTPLVALRCE